MNKTLFFLLAIGLVTYLLWRNRQQTITLKAIEADDNRILEIPPIVTTITTVTEVPTHTTPTTLPAQQIDDFDYATFYKNLTAA